MNTEEKLRASSEAKRPRKRVRWYCSVDEPFLCQPCDASVHSANQLASRHKRVPFESSSFKVKGSEDSGPACEETSLAENEDQLLDRVPVFDPFDAEILTASNPTENDENERDLDFQAFITCDAELAEF
ncbi:Hypothetical predicted protein [Olea europaea subsp. europaea]|uniref:B box-type domain-containing protein n=1 Tax=Olea europaea subsp. europaea TaxID=158383 RepID=A0A8S0U5Z9_OLEEU|nr:Hypothetical predicted protein [Olea europaea subsp. europaea]